MNWQNSKHSWICCSFAPHKMSMCISALIWHEEPEGEEEKYPANENERMSPNPCLPWQSMAPSTAQHSQSQPVLLPTFWQVKPSSSEGSGRHGSDLATSKNIRLPPHFGLSLSKFAEVFQFFIRGVQNYPSPPSHLGVKKINKASSQWRTQLIPQTGKPRL